MISVLNSNGMQCKALILKTCSTCFLFTAQLPASHDVTCLRPTSGGFFGKDCEQCRRSELDTQIALLLIVKINTSVYMLSRPHKNRRHSGCVSFITRTWWARFVSVCMCVLTTSHRTASVTRVSTKLALPRH